MTMSETMLALVVAEAKPAAEQHEDVESQLRAAMSVAVNHWMVLDETTQFKGAVGAVMALHGPESETYKTLAAEVRSLDTLSAATSGIPVDFSAIEIPEKPYGIVALWREAKEKQP